MHEAVLHIGSRSVKEEIYRLASVTETINDKDLHGRTPLSWAASRGDTQATELLLQHGADPNIADNVGRVPACYNVRTGQSKCIALLHQYGADLNAADMKGTTIMHRLAVHGHGQDFKQTAELLHSLHVNIDSQNIYGLPVLFAAVTANNIEGVRWLLDHNVDYKVYAHGTLLHYVGLCATFDLIDVIHEAQLVGIDVHDLEPDEEKSALEMLNHPSRGTPATPEMIERFTLLLNGIEERTIAESIVDQLQDVKLSRDTSAVAGFDDDTKDQVEEEEEDEEGIFEDAVQEQRGGIIDGKT